MINVSFVRCPYETYVPFKFIGCYIKITISALMVHSLLLEDICHYLNFLEVFITSQIFAFNLYTEKS